MSVLAGFFAAWRGAGPRRLTRSARRATVRPLPAPVRRPQTEAERVLLDTLAAQGALPPRALVSHAACALYRRELTHGGALADVGLFGENLFIHEMARALETGRGALWDIEPGP
jgi:hypothetical protein